MTRAVTAAAALVVTLPAIADVPADTVLEVRLLTAVSSYNSRKGTRVEAEVVAPACPRGVPPGATVIGTVKGVHKVGLGLIHERASLEIDFRELHLPSGESYAVRTRLLGVENAREHVDRRGIIRGIRATASLSNRMSSHVFFAIDDHPFLLIPVFVAETAIFQFPDPEISYGPGTEMSLQLEDPIPGSELSGCDATDVPVVPDDSEELANLVAGLPAWTYTKRLPRPMDPTNLAFVGSRQALDRAFAAAGWTGSESMSPANGMRVVRAIAEGHEYADAPMRTLLLEGTEPDMSRQKALNTFVKRDHLRIWKRLDSYHGQPVWAGAATKDIAVTFTLRSGFTHEIQNDVDVERDKVVSDLVFTGCVDSVSYIRRPELAMDLLREGRKGLTTDARVAVIALNDCVMPHMSAAMATERPQVPVAVRCVRRVTLTARNHILRDHMLWKRAEAGWMAYRMARYYYQERFSRRHALTAAVQADPAPTHAPPANDVAGN